MPLRLLARVTAALALAFVAAIAIVRARPYENAPVQDFVLPPVGCVTPCWQGIQPGVTALADAIALLETHPWVADVFPASEPGGAFVHWTWSLRFPFADRSSRGILFARDGVVRSIDLQTHIPFGDLWLISGAPRHGKLGFTRDAMFHYGVYPELGLQVFSLVYCPTRLRTFWHSDVNLKFSTDLGAMTRYTVLDWLSPRVC